MDHPFSKSVSITERQSRLMEMIESNDTLAILIQADPDAMASALALKRLFWRKIKKTEIYRINEIKRADNRAFIHLLNVKMEHIRNLKAGQITKWAVLDSQPHHNEKFGSHSFDIIIDHHPQGDKTIAGFMDIKDDYGATSTILTEYLKAAKIKPSPRLATALFYGIKTDTDNFIRQSQPNDINAFQYLYKFTNLNLIKKIESSEMTKKTLSDFRIAMDKVIFIKDTAYVHMGKVTNTDVLVMITDFFMKLAEVTWSIVSGIYDNKLVVIFRNAGFRRDAGRRAQKMFHDLGTAGGHRSAARAEISLERIPITATDSDDYMKFVLERIRTTNLDQSEG